MKTDSNLREDLLVFIIAAALYLALSYHLFFNIDFAYGDAIARAGNAFFVWNHSDHPKIANLGFVWLPLVPFLQLPLALIDSLAVTGFTGPIISSITGALGVLFMNRLMRIFVGKGRFILLAAYALNPMVLFYSINGMSEITTILLLILTLYSFSKWYMGGRDHELVKASVFSALGCLVRYEMWLFSLFMAAVIFYIVLFDRKRGTAKAEGSAFSYIFLPLSVMLIWIMANAIIMENPFYFLYGSGDVHGEVGEGMLEKSRTDASFGFLKQVFFIFPFTALGFLMLPAVRNRLPLYLLISAIPFFAFHFILVANLMSYGWERFVIYMIPVGFIFGASVIGNVAENWKKVSIMLLIIVSTYFSLFSFYEFELPNEVKRVEGVIALEESAHSYERNKDLIRFINSELTEGKILADSLRLDYLILYSGRPQDFVDWYDEDFRNAVRNPTRFGVEYIIVAGEAHDCYIGRIFPSLRDINITRPEVEVMYTGNDLIIYKVNEDFKKGLFEIKNMTYENGNVSIEVFNYDDEQKIAVYSGTGEPIEKKTFGQLETYIFEIEAREGQEFKVSGKWYSEEVSI